MALFKINKGLAENLAKNMPYAKEGFAYFTKDDGKFYIDIDGDGTTTEAVVNVNRIPLNAAKADVALTIQATAMANDDDKVYPILAFNITDSTKNLVEAKYGQIGIKNGTLVIPNVANKDEVIISNGGTGRGIVIDNQGTNNAIEVLNGKGIKVAQDPTEDLELATKQYVDNQRQYIDNQNVVLKLDYPTSWRDCISYDFSLDATNQNAYSRLVAAIEKGYTPTIIITDIDETFVYKYNFTQVMILECFLIFAVDLPVDGQSNMGRDFIAFSSTLNNPTTLKVKKLGEFEYVPKDGEVNQILRVNNNGYAKWTDIPSIGDLGGATKDHNHDGTYKKIQTAVSSPTVSTTDKEISFIDTISQDKQGVITATKKTVRDASGTQSGIVSTGAQTFAGNKTFKENVTAPKFIGDLNGNADTSTKWKTARKLTIGSTGKNVDGSTNVSWTLDEIGAAAKSHTHIKSDITDFAHNHNDIYYTEDEIDEKLNAVDDKIATLLGVNDALVFKGIIDDTHLLPTTGYEVGWTYRVNKAGTYAGQKCEQGDLIICIADALSTNTPHWTVAQTNIDGAVIGPASATNNHIVLFDNNTGKLIKDSGKTLSDLANAKHTHAISDITNLQTTLDGKAAKSHAHTISDTTGLQDALDAKSNNDHTHTITANANDDDIVVLTGVSGTNAVTYTASHAKKGPNASTTTSKGPTTDVTVSGSGTSKSISVPRLTVDQYGHTTALSEQTLTVTLPTIDDALSSSSTNPVQNKVINTALSGKSDTSHTHSYITTIGDKRTDATTPADYNNKLVFSGLKNKASVGSPSNDTYSYILGLRGWNDSSGGLAHELAFNNTGIYARKSKKDGTTETWDNWNRVITGDNTTGSDTQPVYISNGKPTAIKYTIGKSVPSDAKFTDTVYTHPTYTAQTGVPTANQTPGFGGTFSVSQPVSNTLGHITAINSRTITIPKTEATQSAAGLMSASDKAKLDGIASGSQTNQNAFSNVKVGTTTIAAKTTTDTLTVAAGDNITLTSDATNKKLTIAATNTDTKVTEVGNHYTPAADADSALSVDASSSTAATWGTTSLVTGVNLQRDAKGHVTGVTVDSIKMPANPNTNTHQTSKNIVGASDAAKANAAATNGNVYLNHLEDTTITSKHKIVGTGGTSVTSDSNGNITINSTTYSHPASSVTAGTYKSVTVNEQGHVTAGTNPTTLAEYGITDAKKKQTVKTSPVANGNSLAFIDTISQDEQGVITATSKYVTVDTELNENSSNPIANKAVALKLEQFLAANDAMVFKGTIGSDAAATIHELPANHSAGETYRVYDLEGGTNDENGNLQKGYYVLGDKKCEIGDLIICIKDGTAKSGGDWTIVQTNIDGAVISSSASSTDGNIAVFDGTNGLTIKDSGKTFSNFATSDHTHDDRYYTESEIDTKFEEVVHLAGEETITGAKTFDLSVPDTTLTSLLKFKGNSKDLFGFGSVRVNQTIFSTGLFDLVDNKAILYKMAPLGASGGTWQLNGNALTATTATSATKDSNGKKICDTYLPLAGGIMTGAIDMNSNILSRIGHIQFGEDSTNPSILIGRTDEILGMHPDLGENGYENYQTQLTIGDINGLGVIFGYEDENYVPDSESKIYIRSVAGNHVRLKGILDPIDDYDAVNKKYLDTTVSNTYVKKAGDTMTGNLVIQTSNTNDTSVKCTNTNGSIGLLTSTNRGIYDYTKSKWMLYTDGTKVTTTYPLYGAVWNDYAEFRDGDTIESGKCVIEVGDDTLITSTERMMPGANITSDTFGFAIGETDQAKTPIAVSGRVLAYPYESREEFRKNIGRPVCSGPNGTVSIMTDEEYRDKGYCAIGTISAVPDYEEWGAGNVKVNGRVWIKVF